MTDKILINKAGTEAKVVFDHKTITLYHSEGRVLELVQELILDPVAKANYDPEEVTQVIFKETA